MKEMFILLRQDESLDWYLLCTRDTMYCMACGPLKFVLEALVNICKKYKNSSTLRYKIMETSDGGHVSPAEFSVRKSLVKQQGDKYNHYIDEVVEEYYGIVREKKKLKKVSLVKHKKADLVKPVNEVTEEPKKVITPVVHKPYFKKAIRKPIKVRV